MFTKHFIKPRSNIKDLDLLVQRIQQQQIITATKILFETFLNFIIIKLLLSDIANDLYNRE